MDAILINAILLTLDFFFVIDNPQFQCEVALNIYFLVFFIKKDKGKRRIISLKNNACIHKNERYYKGGVDYDDNQ